MAQDHSRSELSIASDESPSNADEFSSSKQIALKSKEASKRRLQAKASAAGDQSKILDSDQRQAIRAKIKRLRKDVQSDETEATQVDKEIEKKTAALKNVLLKAKRIRRDGDNLEAEAKEVNTR